jgi:hypothetical protein
MKYCLTPQEWVTHPLLSKAVVKYVSLRPTVGFDMGLVVETKKLVHTYNLKRRMEVGRVCGL